MSHNSRKGLSVQDLSLQGRVCQSPKPLSLCQKRLKYTQLSNTSDTHSFVVHQSSRRGIMVVHRSVSGRSHRKEGLLFTCSSFSLFVFYMATTANIAHAALSWKKYFYVQGYTSHDKHTDCVHRYKTLKSSMSVYNTEIMSTLYTHCIAYRSRRILAL